ARRLVLVRLDLVQDGLDAVDGGKNQGDALGGDRHSVEEFADQGLGGMRQGAEPGKPEKAAGAFDRMDKAKNVAEDAAIVRLLLEVHEFGVDPIDTLIGLGQEYAEQLVHTRRLVRTRAYAGQHSMRPRRQHAERA